jgi:hypothetical protein
MKHKHIYPIFSLAVGLLLAGSTYAQTGVSLRPKVYLQGALHGLSASATLMRDDLRKQQLIPLTEPYTGRNNFQHAGTGGGETITNPSVLQVTGGNAIVDWVVMELRSVDFMDQAVATRSALLQRDGDVVDVDGVSAVQFPNTQPGAYLVVINHRTHLGVMTEVPLQLSANPTEVDFSAPGFPIICGEGGMITLGAKRALWGGDLNDDGRAIFQGPGNDILKLFITVLNDQKNKDFHTNFISTGYLDADANMDGKAIYSGLGNDRSVLFQFLMSHGFPFNAGDVIPVECIP